MPVPDGTVRIIGEALGAPRGRGDGGAGIRRNRPVTRQHEAGLEVRYPVRVLVGGPRGEGTAERAIHPADVVVRERAAHGQESFLGP
jgi:hypothetical protein